MGSRLEANSSSVRKRIEKHKFENEQGEEYEASKFGGFPDYFRRKKIKLQNLDAELRSSAAGNPPIFRGVVAHVNGYTQPSLNDLHNLIVSHGGGFMQYLDGKTTVTHIIASNLTPKKKVEFSKYRIVKPAWVVDSVEIGKLLPWDAYRVVDEGVGQRVLGFDNGNVTSQANRSSGGYRDQSQTSWYSEQIKNVADDLKSRGPRLPFSDTQLHPANDIESDERGDGGGLSLSKTRPGSVHRRSDSSSGHGQDREVDRHIASVRFNNDLKATDSEPEASEFNFDLDLDTIPAADDPFTDSFSDAQGLINHHPPDQSFKMVSGQTLDPVEHSASRTTIAAFDTSQNQDAQHPSQQPLVTNTVSRVPIDQRSTKSPLGLTIEGSENHSFALLTANEPLNAGASGDSNILKDEGRRLDEMSAEEHNALLLTDPKVWKSTVVNPGFLKQYYEESRLHHLSAWKAALKSRLQALAAERSPSQKAREKRAPGARRYVLHVDFDSFFAAVSLKKAPEFIDKPVVVAHGNGSAAEIASCNYPARKFGIKNGMWMKQAQTLCSDLKVLPYDFKAYEDASRDFYEAIIDTGGVVQSVSVDEALVDVSAQCIAAGGHRGKGIQEGDVWREQAKADDIAADVRNKIKEQTGCTVSVGIGGNILLAKVALRKAKPAGQYHIKPEDALDFLGELTMQDLPGIAYSIGGKLEEIGVKYVKDVRQLSKERMTSVLGPKTGEKVWDYSRGIDRAEVGDQVTRKSVSAEVNWGIRFVTQDQVDEFIQSLCDELHKRLVTEGVKGLQLTMKIMRRAVDAPRDPPKHLGHGKCDTFNKSLVMGVATNDRLILGREALSILKGFGFSPGELRGLGVQMTKLEPLRGTIESPSASGQRRLQFKTSDTPKSRLPRDDPIADDPIADDPIADDIESPRKPKAAPPPHPAAVFAGDGSPDGKPRKPLNTLGTQFVMPSQVDPDVLAELPQDIRSKLLAKTSSARVEQSYEETAPTRSRSTTPAFPAEAIPSESQLDQETLDALPDDVRAEVLSFYHNSSRKSSHNQAILPQSPRKTRSIKLPKKLTTPTKKRTGLQSRSVHNARNPNSLPTLTQSNFVALTTKPNLANPSINDQDPDEIPADFLSALPPDIRAEVLAQHRRSRLQKKGGIDVTSTKSKRPLNAKNLPPGQRLLRLPPPAPKPTFTAKKLTRLPDLREAISAWFEEFRDEGPYDEDVEALVGYLKKVVGEEGDMAKAVGVGKWVEWVVGEGLEGQGQGGSGAGKASWEKTVTRVHEGVQDAVRKRGLGDVRF